MEITLKLNKDNKGFVMVITLVLLAVLTIMGIAGITISGFQLNSAGATVLHNKLQECAQTGINYILSQSKGIGGNLTVSYTTPIITVTNMKVLAGHYGETPPLEVTAIEGINPANAGFSGSGERSLTSRLRDRKSSLSGMGSMVIRGTVHCQIEIGAGVVREYEIEFSTVRGL